MPTNCQFVFTRATPVYYSGEQITGHICLTTTKKLPLEGLTLTFVGAAQTEWTARRDLPLTDYEYNDSSDAENKIVHEGIEEYIKESIKLADRITLEPTVKHIHYFHFTVPEHMPATCRHKYGEVAYELNLELQRATTFNNVFRRTVVLKNRIDLNEETKLQERCFIGNGGGRQNGNNLLEFSIPCGGFVPGQLITYQLEYADALEQNKVRVNLCQRSTFRCLQPVPKTKEVIKVLTCCKNHVIKQGARLVKEGHISVPLATPATTTYGNCLLQVSYYLEAVVMNGKHKVLQKLRLPIKIGTVALKTAACKAAYTFDGYCYDNYASTDHDDTRSLIAKQPFIYDEQFVEPHNAATIAAKEYTGFCDKIALMPLREKSDFWDIEDRYC